MIDLKKDCKDYLLLLTILSFGLLAFVYFGYDRQIQINLMFAMAVLYIVWGVLHHHLKGDFHIKVLLEYVAVAFFAVVLVMVLLGRV